MLISSEIDNCFRSPRAPLPSSRFHTVLYFLRCDLENLYGSEKRRYIKNYKSPMLAVLGMMSGIDLLTKLYSGKAYTTSDDFKNFVKKYGNLKKDEAETIYHLRCALAHNYGLVSTKPKKDGKFQYTFSIDDLPNNEKLIEQINENTYKISLWQLKRLFLNCIKEFESSLRNHNHPDFSKLLNNFMNVMKEIGHIEIIKK